MALYWFACELLGLIKTGEGALNANIPSIPFYPPRYPYAQFRLRFKPHIALQLFDIGVGRFHIARLHRQKIFLRLLPQRVFNRFDEGHQLYRLVVADVVDLVGCVA